MVTERRGKESAASTGTPGTVEELRSALVARDELIAVIGHELRNAMAPLVLLAGQLELAPGADDMMRAKMAMLTRNLNGFVGTLDRVAEVAQLREGKLRLAPQNVDAQDVVLEVGRALARMASAGGCELRFETTSVEGYWDRARLEQIVTHLVTNAIRYAGGGPIEISVRPAGASVEIVVQDAGPGIPASEREHVFDRFDRRGARRTGGLGVGLWVVKSLCRAMRGEVRLVESARGARFSVVLPRA